MTTPFSQPSPSDPPDPSTQSFRQRASDAYAASDTPPGRWNAAKFGYQWGKGQAQGGTQGGWGSIESYNQGVSNGNGGDNEFATKGDVQAAHDSLSGQLGGIQGGAAQQVAAGIQSRNDAFGGGGSQASQAPRPNMMADMADHNARMQASMADSHSALQASRDRSSMVHANRTAQTASIAAPTMSGGLQARGQMQSTGGITGITGSGIGASAGQNESTMSGMLPVQNAISDSNYANQRFRGQ